MSDREKELEEFRKYLANISDKEKDALIDRILEHCQPEDFLDIVKHLSKTQDIFKIIGIKKH